MDHNYKPDPEFKGKGPLYFGFELETDEGSNREEVVSKVGELDIGYCKEDGSLSEIGVEIVSHPMSWEYIKENKGKIERLLKFFRENDWKSHSAEHSTCGMHVHLSREAFTSLHVYKFMKLFYENKPFIFAISGRKKSGDIDQYATFEGENAEAMARTAKQKVGGDKFQAVNLRPMHTIEVRVFGGNLKAIRFFKNLEFVKAAYEFTKESSIVKINVSNFRAYVDGLKKEYPNLARFISTMNY